MKEKYIRVCPKCGSANLGFDGDTPYNTCKECGFADRLSNKPNITSGFNAFLEVKESELENFRKELKKHSHNK